MAVFRICSNSTKKCRECRPRPKLERLLSSPGAYYEIEDADVRKGVYQLTKAMGDAGV
jgi:hypothetical protein